MKTFSKQKDRKFLLMGINFYLFLVKTCLKMYARTKEDYYLEQAKFYGQQSIDWKNTLKNI